LTSWGVMQQSGSSETLLAGSLLARRLVHSHSYIQKGKELKKTCKIALGEKLRLSNSEAVVRLGWVGAARVLDDDGGRVCPSFAATLHVLALGQSCKEAAHESIASTVGVHNL